MEFHRPSNLVESLFHEMSICRSLRRYRTSFVFIRHRDQRMLELHKGPANVHCCQEQQKA